MRPHHLQNTRWPEVRELAFAWVDTFQKIKHARAFGAHAMQAVAVTFLVMCERFELEPREVLDVAHKQITHSRYNDPRYLRAIENYVRKELDDV